MSKTLTGKVTSIKNDKTITVTVTTHKTHPLYKKRYISSKKFLAHDEKNEAEMGDSVIIEETRPYSRNKHFKLKQITEKAEIKHTEGEEK